MKNFWSIERFMVYVALPVFIVLFCYAAYHDNSMASPKPGDPGMWTDNARERIRDLVYDIESAESVLRT